MALEFGWEGRTWLQALELPEHKHVAERAERLRRQLVPPFAELAGQEAAPLTGGRLADSFRRLWAALNVQATLENWSCTADQSPLAKRRSQIHATVWEQMNLWLDNLALAFPREALPLRDWLPILEAGLSTLTVGVIPPALDQVLIGTVDRSRNSDLIDFSNRNFYGSRLQPIPGHPSHRARYAPLTLYRAEGVYKDRQNEAEAAKVIGSATNVTSAISPARAPAGGSCSRALSSMRKAAS